MIYRYQTCLMLICHVKCVCNMNLYQPLLNFKPLHLKKIWPTQLSIGRCRVNHRSQGRLRWPVMAGHVVDGRFLRWPQVSKEISESRHRDRHGWFTSKVGRYVSSTTNQDVSLSRLDVQNRRMLMITNIWFCQCNSMYICTYTNMYIYLQSKFTYNQFTYGCFSE